MTITLKAPSRVLVLLVATVIVLLLLATAVSALGTDGWSGPPTADYTVRSGDTLWDIAATVAPDDDVREVVHLIRRWNDLEGSIIRPGQVLAVPAG
jgi:LysM repeat protein